MTHQAGTGVAMDPPDHATTLAWRTAPGEPGELLIMGPRTRALYHERGPGEVSCVLRRLPPGRAKLVLGHDARDLVDRRVALPDLWGDRFQRIARQLRTGTDPAGLLNRLANATVASGPALWHSDLVWQAAALLSGATAHGRQPVSATARRLHVSERHLRNLFMQFLGLSPRQFITIARVRTVLAGPEHRNLSDVATGAGYYDQSHMTDEFRRVMGVPPAAFFAGRRPIPSPCGATRNPPP